MKSLATFLQRVSKGIYRFPLSLLFALLATFLSIYIIDIGYYESSDTLIQALLSSIFGFFITTAAYLFKNRAILIVAIISTLGYYLLLDLYDTYKFRYIFLELAFVLLGFIAIFWAPFLGKNSNNSIFWSWSKHTLYSFLISIFIATLLYLGIAGALLALENLFDISILDKRYFQIFIASIGIFGSLFFLSLLLEEPKELPYSKVELFFTKYILTSLSLIYLVILYSYTLKIIINNQWPKGGVAWIVLIFSLVALTTYLFWLPIIKKEYKKYLQWLLILLIPQIFILSLALYIRVESYGWSIRRVLVLYFALWLFGSIIYFLLSKNAKLKYIFLAFSAALVLSQVGHFSIYNITKSSQQKRLKLLLENKNNPEASYHTIEYLVKYYGINSIKPILPNLVAEFEAKQKTTKSIWEFLEFAKKRLNIGSFSFKPIHLHKKRRELEIKGYDYLIMMNYPFRVETKGYIIEFIRDSIKISKDKKIVATFSLKEFIEQRAKDRDEEKLVFEASNNRIAIKFLIDYLTFTPDKKLRFIDGVMLLKFKE